MIYVIKLHILLYSLTHGSTFPGICKDGKSLFFKQGIFTLRLVPTRQYWHGLLSQYPCIMCIYWIAGSQVYVHISNAWANAAYYISHISFHIAFRSSYLSTL